jgi:hypothetical protein
MDALTIYCLSVGGGLVLLGVAMWLVSMWPFGRSQRR